MESRREASVKHLALIAPGALVWRCTSDEWITCAALLEPLAEGKRGHQYLTEERYDDVLIEVSHGEAHGSRTHQARCDPRHPDAIGALSSSICSIALTISSMQKRSTHSVQLTRLGSGHWHRLKSATVWSLGRADHRGRARLRKRRHRLDEPDVRLELVALGQQPGGQR
jgi:hypothetical protein